MKQSISSNLFEKGLITIFKTKFFKKVVLKQSGYICLMIETLIIYKLKLNNQT